MAGGSRRRGTAHGPRRTYHDSGRPGQSTDRRARVMPGWYDISSPRRDVPACRVCVDDRGCVARAVVTPGTSSDAGAERPAAPAVTDGRGGWLPMHGIAYDEFVGGYGRVYCVVCTDDAPTDADTPMVTPTDADAEGDLS